jgi:hypothetical protein
MKKWMWYALVVLSMPLLLYACERIEKARQIGQSLERAFEDVGTTALVWDEEVKLHDGRAIVIKRREVKSGRWFSGFRHEPARDHPFLRVLLSAHGAVLEIPGRI